MKNTVSDIKWRMYLIYGLICVFALFVIGKTVTVQFINGNYWQNKAENLTYGYRDIEAVRGNIYSADGSLLATSIPIYEIRFDPNTESISDEFFYGNVDSLSWKLSKLFEDKSVQQYRTELVKAREKGSRYHLIKRNVKYTELKKLKNFPIFRKGRYKGGLIYIQKNKREKPFNVLAARTIGYDREGIYPVGLEGAYKKELQGQNGKRLMQKISGGVWMPVEDENEVDPNDGDDVYTTIDINIQDVAESALLKQLEKHKADHGCVVMMEVETGEVKAIANLKRNSKGKYYEGYNYAIGESTEPGSTFKLPAIMAALEDGFVKLSDHVDTENGKTKYYDRTMYDSNYGRGGHGKITVREAFEISSNVGISKIITKSYSANPGQFVDRLYRMNLNDKLGIEIAGEGDPLIKSTDHESWSGTTIPWMSIGYEVRLTPLQILTFYNAVANGGKMVRPKFVNKIKKRGKVLEEVETEVINPSICSRETIEKARQLLKGVVEEGTAKNLKNSTYKIAGKTGTAQIANDKYGYRYESKISYQASFVGYFPADDPKYSCIVVVNAPSSNVYYGNLVAGPIFKEVADKVYANSLHIHDEMEKQENIEANSPLPYAMSGNYNDLKSIYGYFDIQTQPGQVKEDWVTTSTGDSAVRVKGRKLHPVLVPNVVGMGIRDAVYLLENRGLRVDFTGRGMVTKQSVAPGKKIKKGTSVKLELS